MKIPVNEQDLEMRIERMILAGGAKLSDLLLFCWSPEEGEIVKELPDKIISALRENITRQNAELSDRIDTNKIHVFFSKRAIKMVNGEPKPIQFLIDRRKYGNPNVSRPSIRPFEDIGQNKSHLN